jgi:NTE family protein/lysophospholipid hydrolase
MLVEAGGIERSLGVGSANRDPGDPRWGELASWLSIAERDHDQVVYATDLEPTQWTQTCLRQADRIVFVGLRSGDTRPNEIEDLINRSDQIVARRELVLISSSAGSINGTEAWLAPRDVSEHHHVVQGSIADIRRLSRVIRGEACGLVLSGGGPRGLAHLGAMRALEEAGVPFDYIGGTSIGAVMGALAALGLNDRERMRQSARLTSRRGFLDVTLPVVALASGRRVNESLGIAFGDKRIEDLARPYFCVSADLVSAREVVHQRGELWRAVRASLSLPGVFPPVASDGALLVDGAALNNLPVDEMRERIPLGTVVAVDLFPGIAAYTSDTSELTVSGWRELGRRLRTPSHARAGRAPGIVDVLSRSNALSGVRWRQSTVSSHRIDLHLQPPLPTVGALDFKAALPFVEIGYQHTADALASSGFAERFA